MQNQPLVSAGLKPFLEAFFGEVSVIWFKLIVIWNKTWIKRSYYIFKLYSIIMLMYFIISSEKCSCLSLWKNKSRSQKIFYCRIWNIIELKKKLHLQNFIFWQNCVQELNGIEILQGMTVYIELWIQIESILFSVRKSSFPSFNFLLLFFFSGKWFKCFHVVYQVNFLTLDTCFA